MQAGRELETWQDGTVNVLFPCLCASLESDCRNAAFSERMGSTAAGPRNLEDMRDHHALDEAIIAPCRIFSRAMIRR